MSSLKLFLEGFIIGIGKVIPGVSGAMFAMMFGVYEKALNIISNLRKELFKNFKFIFILGLGVVLAIIFGSNIIKKCLDNYYMFTMFLFIGMMTAGINPLFKNVKDVKVKLKNIICAIFVSLILILLDFVDLGITEGVLTKTPLTVIMLVISGFIDALGTIIPGVCGTALLMILGYYNIVISALGDILNLSNLANNLFVLIPFLIGMGIGVLLISKVINYLFRNYKIGTYYTIIGFAIASTIILFVKAISNPYTTFELIISIVFFLIGYVIATLIRRLED